MDRRLYLLLHMLEKLIGELVDWQLLLSTCVAEVWREPQWVTLANFAALT